MLLTLPLATHDKVSVTNRVISKVIDLLLVFLVSAILPYPVGFLLGFLYSIFADGINIRGFRGQSVGKKIMKLRVVNTITQAPATWKESALRNTPVGVATFFGIIPLWGWIILALVGIPLMVMEIYLMLTVATGHRLGDVMGDTEVLEVKRDWVA
jgi:uncharacterized RDD family membrane protein YckC